METIYDVIYRLKPLWRCVPMKTIYDVSYWWKPFMTFRTDGNHLWRYVPMEASQVHQTVYDFVARGLP